MGKHQLVDGSKNNNATVLWQQLNKDHNSYFFILHIIMSLRIINLPDFVCLYQWLSEPTQLQIIFRINPESISNFIKLLYNTKCSRP